MKAIKIPGWELLTQKEKNNIIYKAYLETHKHAEW